MHKNKFTFATCCWLSLLLTLGGCMQTPREIPQLSIAERKQYLSQLCNWQFSGRLGIRNKDEGHNISIDWQQNNNKYRLYFFSPLAIDSATIEGQPGHVVLITSDGNRYEARTPEKLILDHLGWNLPFCGLEYWIKGLPAVHSTPTALKYDAHNQLIFLQQDGWHIEYEEYVVFSRITLPEKITLTNNDIKLKIIINRWKK